MPGPALHMLNPMIVNSNLHCIIPDIASTAANMSSGVRQRIDPQMAKRRRSRCLQRRADRRREQHRHALLLALVPGFDHARGVLKEQNLGTHAKNFGPEGAKPGSPLKQSSIAEWRRIWLKTTLT